MNNHQIESCMDACLACVDACRKSAQLFRDTPGTAQCVKLCLDCGNHCVICWSDLRDNSPLLTHSSRMCAFACDLCAIECSRHKADHMDRSVAACRHCADECYAVRLAIGETVMRSTKRLMQCVALGRSLWIGGL